MQTEAVYIFHNMVKKLVWATMWSFPPGLPVFVEHLLRDFSAKALSRPTDAVHEAFRSLLSENARYEELQVLGEHITMVRTALVEYLEQELKVWSIY